MTDLQSECVSSGPSRTATDFKTATAHRGWSHMFLATRRKYGCRDGNVGRPVGALGLNITSTTGCITVRLSADIHAPQRMDPPEFDDSLTFPSFHNGGI